MRWRCGRSMALPEISMTKHQNPTERKRAREDILKLSFTEQTISNYQLKKFFKTICVL